jgi:hypothetical protein
MQQKGTLEWLLDEDQPSIRYLTLTTLLGRPEDDSEVESAKEMIAKKGWAADILAQQNPAGWWVSDESLYRPKYQSTNWMLLVLSDLGLTNANPKIEKACKLWIRQFARRDGGFSMEGMRKSRKSKVAFDLRLSTFDSQLLFRGQRWISFMTTF